MNAIVRPPNQTVELVGHQIFENEFARLWVSQELPHAFLLAGE